MAKFNDQIELDPADVDIIEEGLRRLMSFSEPVKVRRINSLLGKIHNQKIWYEPEKFVPRG